MVGNGRGSRGVLQVSHPNPGSSLQPCNRAGGRNGPWSGVLSTGGQGWHHRFSLVVAQQRANARFSLHVSPRLGPVTRRGDGPATRRDGGENRIDSLFGQFEMTPDLLEGTDHQS